MANNIVYMLGAGASVGALPVVTEMVDRMAVWVLFNKILYLTDEQYEEIENIRNTINKTYQTINMNALARLYDTPITEGIYSFYRTHQHHLDQLLLKINIINNLLNTKNNITSNLKQIKDNLLSLYKEWENTNESNLDRYKNMNLGIQENLTKFEAFIKNNTNTIYEQIQTYMNIINETHNRRSIDTYAKELYLQNKTNEYNTLKELLKEYLEFEQNKINNTSHNNYLGSLNYFINYYNSFNTSQINLNSLNHEDIKIILEVITPSIFRSIIIKQENLLKNISKSIQQMLQKPKSTLDQRYINFLVDILDGDVNKIKIFSWNYDTQFQKAVEELNLQKGTETYINAQLLLNNEIKLNGSINEEEIKFAWETKEEEIKQKVDNTIPTLIPIQTDANNRSRYATQVQYDLIHQIRDIVIIGYSFPFANRKIDKIVLENIFCRLSRIVSSGAYISINIAIQVPNKKDPQNPNKEDPQNPKEYYNDIKEALEGILTSIDILPKYAERITITHKQDIKSFFIPAHY